MKEISKIGVVGAGLMGSGIAQVAASAGFDVVICDLSEELLEKSLKGIKKILARGVEKGRMSQEEADAISKRLSTVKSVDSMLDVDAVIEAVTENIDLKKKVFKELGEKFGADVLLLSNTSCLSISDISGSVKFPERFLGMHFFYPATLMKLVEVTKSVASSEEAFKVAKDLAAKFDKHAVDSPDLPGFIVNRLFVPQANEAIYLVMEGVKPEDIDASMKFGLNHPMGPLELADFVGLDTLLFSMEGIFYGFGDSKYRPCPLLKNMVKAGRLGRKTGQGFYEYDSNGGKK